MALIPVAVEYIEIHREDSSDKEIAKALKDQGFSDEVLAAAFRAAGERPAGSAPPARLSPARRAVVVALAAVSVLLFIASALLFVRNFRQASAEAGAESR
jgi:anti-sigma factor RsiW